MLNKEDGVRCFNSTVESFKRNGLGVTVELLPVDIGFNRAVNVEVLEKS